MLFYASVDTKNCPAPDMYCTLRCPAQIIIMGILSSNPFGLNGNQSFSSLFKPPPHNKRPTQNLDGYNFQVPVYLKGQSREIGIPEIFSSCIFSSLNCSYPANQNLKTGSGFCLHSPI